MPPPKSWASVVAQVLDSVAHGGRARSDDTPGAPRLTPPDTFLALLQHDDANPLGQTPTDGWATLRRAVSTALPHAPADLFAWSALSTGDPLESHMLSLLLLFLAVMRRQSQPVYAALTQLDQCHQLRFKEVFDRLLQASDRITRDVLEDCLESEAESDASSVSSFDTPKSHHAVSRIKQNVCFSNSPLTSKAPKKPPTPSSPLKDFLDSPVTKQLAKFQEIAQAHKRMTLDVRAELDQEKANCASLQEQLSRAKRDNAEVKASLKRTRNELNHRESENVSEELGRGVTQLQRRFTERQAEENRERAELELLESTSKVEQLERELECWKGKLQESHKKTGEYEAQVVSLKYEVGSKAQESAAMRETLQDKINQIVELNALVESLRSNNSNLDESMKSPGGNGGGENMGNILEADMQTKVWQMEEELEGARAEIVQKAAVIQEVEAVKVQVQEKLAEVEVAATAQIAEKVSAIETMEASIVQLQTVVADREQVVVALQEDVVVKSSTMQKMELDFQEQVQDLSGKVEMMTGELEMKASEVNNLKAAKETLIQQKEEETAALAATIEQNVAQHQMVVQQFQEEVSNKQTQIEEFASNNETMSQELQQRTETIVAMESQIEQAQQTNTELLEKTASLEQVNAESQQLVEELNNDVLDKSNQIQELTVDIATTRQELQEVQAESSQMVERLQTELMNVKTEFQELTEKANEEKAAIRQHVETIEKLESQIEEKTGEVDTLKHDLHQLEETSRQSYQTMETQYKQTLEASSTELDQAVIATKALGEAMAAAEKNNLEKQTSLEMKLDTVTKTLQERQQEMESVQATLEKGGEEADMLQEQLAVVRTQLFERSNEVEVLRSQKADLEAETKASLEELTQLKEESDRTKEFEIERLQEMVKSLGEEQTNTKIEIQSREEEMEEVKAALAKAETDQNTACEEVSVIKESLQQASEESAASLVKFTEANAALEAKVDEMTVAIETQRMQHASTLEELTRAHAQVVDAHAREMSHMKELNAGSADSLNGLVEEKERQLSEGGERYEALKAKKAATEQELTEKMAAIKEKLEEKIADSQAKAVTLEQNVLEIQNEVQQRDNMLAEVNSQLEAKSEAAQQLVAQLNDINAVKEQLEEGQAQQEEQVQRMEEQLRAKEQNLAEQQNELAKSGQLIHERDEQIDNLEATVQEKERQYVIALEEERKNTEFNAEAEEKIAALTAQIEIKEQEKNLAQEKQAGMTTQNETLQATLEATLQVKEQAIIVAREEERRAAQEHVEQVTAEAEEKMAALVAQVEAREEESKLAQEKLEEIVAQNATLQATLEATVQEKEQAIIFAREEECKIAQEKLQGSAAQVTADAEEKIGELVAQLEAKEQERKLSEEKQAEIIAQNEALQASLEEAKANATKLEEDISSRSDAKTEMKVKYQSKLKEFSKAIEGRYQSKIEECQQKFKEDIDNKERDCQAMHQAKEKAVLTAEELEMKLRHMVPEEKHETLRKKYEAVKLMFAQSQTKLNALAKKEAPMPPPKPVLTRSNSTVSGKSSSAASKKEASVFKLPMDTPGRAKPGRTKSDLNVVAAAGRKPPVGVGKMFKMDDEDGEMFSSSYLTDMKSGTCDPAGKLSNDPSRLSELSRRNSMYPAHLQSSYPAETQFFPTTSFSDTDLRRGRLSDVHGLTEKTTKMNLGSPAFNTRSVNNRRQVAGESEAPPPVVALRTPAENTRKRRSGTNFRGMPTMDDSTPPSVKRLRREVGLRREGSSSMQTSYSKPGPPTPASKFKRSAVNNGSFTSHNTSTASSMLNMSTATNDKTHDKTPLLDCTNTNNVTAGSSNINVSGLSSSTANRSLRKRIIGTPKSLKSVMTGAFRGRKYAVKGQSDHV